jgi:hypothetical protein
VHRLHRRRTVAVAATALLAGLFSAPAGHAQEAPRRVVENLDRGLVAVPSGSGGGAFLSWRLLGTEYARYGNAIAFNVYKNGRRLNRTPVIKSTTYQDNTPGNGTYTVRAVVNGHEWKPSSAALDFAQGYAEIPLATADGYTVQHAWPGDLDGDGRYEIVVSRLSGTRGKPDLLEAYALTGERLWRVDQGPGSYTQVGGNGANDPAPAAISGSTAIGGYRNDDNVTVFHLDGDGRSEVLVHTADGTTFADGSQVTAASPANQFVSVIDGPTGTERARQPVPDDFVADGPSGGHFGIAYLDPDRPGLEGFAIQQAELGVIPNFPWYYYDADTGERLVTGQHPADWVNDTDIDVGRGSTGDIDPNHPGYEYWTSTADVTAPGAGVHNVQDGKVSTTTPSVNFRIWWDGDKASENLDHTYVEKWDPATQTSAKIFEPTGVVAGARNATPFYGDLLGDWREEILAETADHTALRLYTTTEPTRTRIYTLAQNAEYRLGWTVRGYLQSTYTDYHLGTETRRVPKPSITLPEGAVRSDDHA